MEGGRQLGGVGDPNQAIFETFTTANPELLRAFIRDNKNIPMPESGRSQPSIINLANHLIDWTMSEHPIPEARDALSPPYIEPTPENDPQPNPSDDPSGIRLISKKFSPDEEVNEVVKSIESWLPDHKDLTVAVLTSTNDHAAKVAEALKQRKIEYRELLRSTSPTCAVAGALSYVSTYLAARNFASKLAQAYRVWRRIGAKMKSMSRWLNMLQIDSEDEECGRLSCAAYPPPAPPFSGKMGGVSRPKGVDEGGGENKGLKN